MRTCYWLLASFAVTSFTYAQESPSPSDVAPPPEINVPTNPEAIPTPKREPIEIDGHAEGAKFLKLGTIVEGNVPLYAKVRIEDADEIHPRAVPFVIAVMDPHEGPWHPHSKIKKFIAGETPDDPPTPVVFVKVFLPPEALSSMKIRREEIDFKYGGSEVNIDSEDGVVTIEYDD